MAKDGKKAEDIVKYYYKGTAVSNADEFLNKYMAKIKQKTSASWRRLLNIIEIWHSHEFDAR